MTDTTIPLMITPHTVLSHWLLSHCTMPFSDPFCAFRPAGVDPAVSIANDAAHTGSLSLLASSTPSRLTTEQTESVTLHSTEDSSPTGNGTGTPLMMLA